MKLLWSPRSPFVRKVMICLKETGTEQRVECVRAAVMLAAAPNPEVLAVNPLGKIPVLVLDDATSLFDSRVICEYIHTLSEDSRLIPADTAARIECLRWQALGDGLLDVLLLWRTEVSRGAGAHRDMCIGFEAKVRATLATLENEVPLLTERPFAVGHAAIVCALGQIDFRYAECGWKAAHPALAVWYRDLLLRPSVAETSIKDDGAASMGDVVMPLKFGKP